MFFKEERLVHENKVRCANSNTVHINSNTVHIKAFKKQGSIVGGDKRNGAKKENGYFTQEDGLKFYTEREKKTETKQVREWMRRERGEREGGEREERERGEREERGRERKREEEREREGERERKRERERKEEGKSEWKRRERECKRKE